MFTIEADSETFARLQQILANPDTRKVSIGYNGKDEIVVKRNEGMWSHPLPVVKIGRDS